MYRTIFERDEDEYEDDSLQAAEEEMAMEKEHLRRDLVEIRFLLATSQEVEVSDWISQVAETRNVLEHTDLSPEERAFLEKMNEVSTPLWKSSKAGELSMEALKAWYLPTMQYLALRGDPSALGEMELLKRNGKLHLLNGDFIP